MEDKESDQGVLTPKTKGSEEQEVPAADSPQTESAEIENTEEKDVSDVVNEWVEHQVTHKPRESRAQRRWRSTQNRQDKPNIGTVPDDALGDLGDLVEELDEIEEEAKKEPTSIKFGVNDGATLDVKVTTKGDQAIISQLSFDKAHPPGIDDIKQVLEWNFGVVHGVNEAVINELIEQTGSGAKIGEEGLVVAQSTPVEPGENGKISYPFMEDNGQEVPLDYLELQNALQRDNIKEVLQDKLKTRLVAPGTVLAEVIQPTPGTAGRTVLGEEIVQAGEARSAQCRRLRRSRRKPISLRDLWLCVYSRRQITGPVANMDRP